MQANDINVMIFWVCAAIGAGVYAAIIWSLVAYRKSKKQEASFHKSTVTEIVWTVIPLILIIAMMVPAAKLLTRLYNSETGAVGGFDNPALETVQREQRERVALTSLKYS